MRAGKLQHRIQIERLQELDSDSARIPKVWLPVLTTRAEIREASTTEFLTGQLEGDKARAVFLIRWPVQPITTADRIYHGGMRWNITGLSEIGRRRGLEIRAEAAV